MAEVFIPCVSLEEEQVLFTKDELNRSDFLTMLYRHSSPQQPIKTGLYKDDLMSVRAILHVGLYPCTSQRHLTPKGFHNFHELCQYMLIDVDEDGGNDYLNTFLEFLGLDLIHEEPIDEEISSVNEEGDFSINDGEDSDDSDDVDDIDGEVYDLF